MGAHLADVSCARATDTPPRCTTLPDVAAGRNRLQNGIQIFPGSVPIYRGGRLVGGVGVSGDGSDQDAMFSFLGAHNGGSSVGGIGNASPHIHAHRTGVRLHDWNMRGGLTGKRGSLRVKIGWLRSIKQKK